MAQLLVILVLLLALGNSGLAHRVRVIGGKSAQPGQFPFIGALNSQNGQYCDGSIIDKNWIVTAAHCLEEPNQAAIQVLVGTNLLHSGGILYNISAAFIHENYNFSSLQNDIGLIKINGTIEFNDLIKPIEIGVAGTNESVIVLGWGVAEDTDFPEDLRYLGLRALSLEECQQRAQEYQDGLYLGLEQVCTLGKEDEGACYGDSGGPLVSADGTKLVGIVSYGFKPCAKGVPDVFTRPSAYEDWIKEKMLNY